ncbi:hypothetical protein DM01DRAFT_14389 [Hesseltinella vesiculosa]|uniref:Uncharacterized protein n=1 Tax=Hesseltinella vesiculosa TaxID=101127 RepID=A0A1X2GJB4_9FUNG|nr:hypothetical protein DM01DRAFT_14389 [Hesseltinella vesiculosa]
MRALHSSLKIKLLWIVICLMNGIRPWPPFLIMQAPVAKEKRLSVFFIAAFLPFFSFFFSLSVKNKNDTSPIFETFVSLNKTEENKDGERCQ